MCQYSGHSFGIGAELCGIQDSLIKTLGRWQSLYCVCVDPEGGAAGRGEPSLCVAFGLYVHRGIVSRSVRQPWLRCGIQDSLIKTLGRWQSSAYTVYVRTPGEVLQGVANRLCA